jgi:hypothetical protein
LNNTALIFNKVPCNACASMISPKPVNRAQEFIIVPNIGAFLDL